MRKILLMASASSLIGSAFMSDVVETVTVKGKGGHPLRVNKADYDADQAEGGAKKMELHKTEAEQSTPPGPTQTSWPEGLAPTASPAAPDFSGGENTSPPVIDENKQAVAPTAPTPDQKFVKKTGTNAKPKFIVVDGTGEPVKVDGINPDGYATEAEAWNAIMALPR